MHVNCIDKYSSGIPQIAPFAIQVFFNFRGRTPGPPFQSPPRFVRRAAVCPSKTSHWVDMYETFMAGKDQDVAPKLDGLILSNMTSILLSSTSPMLPRSSLTDPSGRPSNYQTATSLAPCQLSCNFLNV